MAWNFGRVENSTYTTARGAMLSAKQFLTGLPEWVPDDWRVWIYEEMLSGILQDWVENGTEEIGQQEAEDLRGLLNVALSVAEEQEHSLRDTTFRIVLKAMVSDWVTNWNLDQ